MKNSSQNNQTETKPQIQGFYANPQVFFNTERGVLTHRIGNDLRIEMPINLYKKILGLPFEKKVQSETQVSTQRKVVYGLLARPSIYLSKDGQYLIHGVLGIRISKHINYYKQILGVEFVATNKTA